MSGAGIYHVFQSFVTVIIIFNTKGYIFHSRSFPLAANQPLTTLSCMYEWADKLTNRFRFWAVRLCNIYTPGKITAANLYKHETSLSQFICCYCFMLAFSCCLSIVSSWPYPCWKNSGRLPIPSCTVRTGFLAGYHNFPETSFPVGWAVEIMLF